MSYVTVTMNAVENQHRQFLDGNLSEEEWYGSQPDLNKGLC
jgi:hypothetical protein